MDPQIEVFLSPEPITAQAQPGPQSPLPATLADELVLEARRRITLRCGKSSITLYPNGKIALRGDYILNDAQGVIRLSGGQIELN